MYTQLKQENTCHCTWIAKGLYSKPTNKERRVIFERNQHDDNLINNFT